MRTTISIDDGLLEDLKRRATERGSTVSRLIEQAVRRMIAGESEVQDAAASFKLVTYGKGGSFSPYDLDKTSALLELDDLEQYRQGER